MPLAGRLEFAIIPNKTARRGGRPAGATLCWRSCLSLYLCPCLRFIAERRRSSGAPTAGEGAERRWRLRSWRALPLRKWFTGAAGRSGGRRLGGRPPDGARARLAAWPGRRGAPPRDGPAKRRAGPRSRCRIRLIELAPAGRRPPAAGYSISSDRAGLRAGSVAGRPAPGPSPYARQRQSGSERCGRDKLRPAQ